jgi:hypothetical protein
MLQNTGQTIRFSDIIREFGLPPNRKLGSFRVSETYGHLSNLPLDEGIPQSGTIKFSNFYNKSLNLIVDLYSSPNTLYKVNAKEIYDLDSNSQRTVRVVGGYSRKPTSTQGKKVFILVNTTIGSDKSSRTSVALRSGVWDQNTNLKIDIGSNGKIYGAGGNGGNGSNRTSNNGGDGTSAIGIDQPNTTLINRGYIRIGYGGGGGGNFYATSSTSGGGKKGPSVTTYYGAAGGGGGGGAGLPAGTGGLLGTGSYNTSGGSNGNAGSLDTRGLGGGAPGANNQYGYSGGNGGDQNSVPTAGGGSGGSAGNNGYCIVISSTASGFSLVNNGTIIGDAVIGTVS